MKRILLIGGTAFILVLVAILITLRVRYGGGNYYPDVTTTPLVADGATEQFFQYDEPVGNLAASKDTSMPTRVFFTVHPESQPTGAKVLEIVRGKAVAYPNEKYQQHFTTVLGMFTDRQHRLWTIDHGAHGTQDVRVSAFDLATNTLVHEYVFPKDVAQIGSFCNDLCVSPDGKYVFIADVSFWRKNPALVVYDVDKRTSWRILEEHPAVMAQDWIIRNPVKEMTFFGGLVALKPGIDGITVTNVVSMSILLRWCTMACIV
jgi:sugar lactone lactonase YvrE